MKKITAMTFVALSLLLFALTTYAPAQGPTPRPDFAIKCSQDTLQAAPGTTMKFQLYLIPYDGFQGTVELSCLSSTLGVACQTPQSTVRLGAVTVVPFAVTAGTAAWAAPGTYPIAVSAKGYDGAVLRSGNISHNEMLYLTVVSSSIKR